MRQTGALSVMSFTLAAATAVVALQESQPTSAPTSAPASAPAEAATQRLKRLDDLVALIEGQNSPAVRRTGARELLVQDWPETPPRVAAILSGSSGPAKIAVATVLADWPKRIDATYIDPLLTMLAGPEAELQAAARALAALRDNGVIPRLRTLVCDTDHAPAQRLGAITALGFMTQREAIDALAMVLTDENPAIAQASLDAFRDVTANEFPDGPAAARRWWDERRSLTDEQWQRMQIERMVRRDRQTRQRLVAAEARLVRVLEANFLRAPGTDRVALLLEYLGDESTEVRLLGLRLTRRLLGEGKSPDTLPPALTQRVRTLLQSTDPSAQESAVRTLTMFREAQDAPTFITMLPGTRYAAVRLALINGLGYVGDGPATRTLLEILEQADEETATEAIAALGRLAERQALATEARATLVGVLHEQFASTKTSQPLLRERILWAMSNLGDPSFAVVFATALDQSEAVAVRQAAVRGITILNDPSSADALAIATNDPDNDVRRTAVDTLARLGTSESHLAALWLRAASPPENDDSIRQTARAGVAALLQRLTPTQLDAWLAAQRNETTAEQQASVAKFTPLIEVLGGTQNVNRVCLGLLRAHLADTLMRVDQVPEAIAAYQAALADLHVAGSTATTGVAVRLLRAALVHETYNETVAAALSGANPTPDPNALHEVVCAIVEPYLTPDGVNRALHVLATLRAHPPAVWPPEIAEQMEQLRVRAIGLKQPSSAPTSQPTSAPTSCPSAGNPPA